jgi:hypothetical protein
LWQLQETVAAVCHREGLRLCRLQAGGILQQGVPNYTLVARWAQAGVCGVGCSKEQQSRNFEFDECNTPWVNTGDGSLADANTRGANAGGAEM